MTNGSPRSGAASARNGRLRRTHPRVAVSGFLRLQGSRISVNVDAIGIGYNFGLHLRYNGYPIDKLTLARYALRHIAAIDRRVGVVDARGLNGS